MMHSLALQWLAFEASALAECSVLERALYKRAFYAGALGMLAELQADSEARRCESLGQDGGDECKEMMCDREVIE
ncbi:hypothetical protein C7B82_10140 [Stenomitos frigidus ULC18]|uniref:Uncharacterized protein n=2 Tax=Stenomitos TaxID=1844270 RepID=A0A2T1EB33_9CYAN|nr:hypothetical protein C7B82_10140 [Stenomitos frigidus ULC18]